MTIKFLFRTCLAMFMISALVACTDESVVDDSDTTRSEPEQDDAEGSKTLNVDGRVFSVPSPAQTAIMLKSLGKGYNKALIVDPAATAQMATKEEKALLMGMYGADLAYSVAFQDGQTGLRMFKAIEGVASDLSLSNAIDKSLVNRFMSNMENDDSLLVLSGVAFRAADQYLKENDRNDISSLVLAGGWIETLNISLSVYAAEPDAKLASRIAEQRSALSNLVAIMSSSSSNEKVADVLAGMNELNSLFKAIPVEYSFEKPVTDVENKTTFINSTTKVNLEGDGLQSITEKVEALRTRILS